jgi:hypothetical protein
LLGLMPARRLGRSRNGRRLRIRRDRHVQQQAGHRQDRQYGDLAGNVRGEVHVLDAAQARPSGERQWLLVNQGAVNLAVSFYR